jgi:hypothetical protein
VQLCSPRDTLEIDGERDCLPIVQWPGYEVRLNSPLMLSHPQVDIHGIFVFFLVELEPSFELELLACDGDLAREAHKL